MGSISLPTTFVDGTVPTAAQFNGDFNAVVNEVNGNLSNANIASSAAIAESKVAFNTSTGHTHNGTDSKLISLRVSYGAFIPGSPSAANDIGTNPRVRAAATATRISVYCRTGPVGQDAIVRVWNVTQGVAVATLTITAVASGSASATSTTITTASLSAGDFLRYDVTQQGTTTLAANISIQLDCTE